MRLLHIAADVVQRPAGVGQNVIDKQLLFPGQPITAAVFHEPLLLQIVHQSRQQVVGDCDDGVVTTQPGMKRRLFRGHIAGQGGTAKNDDCDGEDSWCAQASGARTWWRH
jgi:hypothetical protein